MSGKLGVRTNSSAVAPEPLRERAVERTHWPNLMVSPLMESPTASCPLSERRTRDGHWTAS